MKSFKIYQDGREYFVSKKTGGKYYRYPVEILSNDNMEITFQTCINQCYYLDILPKNCKSEEIQKVVEKFTKKINPDRIIDRSANRFGSVEISFYKPEFLGNLIIRVIEEVCDNLGRKIK